MWGLYAAFCACLGMVVGPVRNPPTSRFARRAASGWLIAAVGLTGKVLGPIGLAMLLARGTWPPATLLLTATNDVVWWIPFAAVSPRRMARVSRRRYALKLGRPRKGAKRRSQNSHSMVVLERVMARLANFPVHRAALAYLVRSVAPLAPRAMGVKGSLARGNFDRYSDIDFYVVVDDAASRDALRKPIFEAAKTFGRPIASFAATHLNDPYMLIAFSESDGVIVKLDVNIVLLDAYPFTRDFLVIAGSQEAVARRIAERKPIEIDVCDAHSKMTGWMWYAYTKIARGELFEAAAALDFMRSLALLPSLQFLRDVPAEGYRRLEQRLSAQDRAALADTYAHGTTADELLRALLSMQEFFSLIHRDIVQKTRIDHRRSDMTAMRSAIEADARSMKLRKI